MRGVLTILFALLLCGCSADKLPEEPKMDSLCIVGA